MKCRTCEIEKHINCFSFKDKKNNRLSTQCKSCDSDYQAKRLADKPEVVRNQWRKAQQKYHSSDKGQATKRLYRYSLTDEEYQSMLVKQEYKCAICKQKKTLVVDHDHLTLKIRGLLCQNCNVGLGKLGDNLEGLNNAIVYLSAVV